MIFWEKNTLLFYFDLESPNKQAVFAFSMVMAQKQ